MERSWFQLVLELCFSSSLKSYPELLAEWVAISDYYSGWTLTEVQGLSSRERFNWLEVAKSMG